jgi:hypothetical protein
LENRVTNGAGRKDVPGICMVPAAIIAAGCVAKTPGDRLLFRRCFFDLDGLASVVGSTDGTRMVVQTHLIDSRGERSADVAADQSRKLKLVVRTAFAGPLVRMSSLGYRHESSPPRVERYRSKNSKNLMLKI